MGEKQDRMIRENGSDSQRLLTGFVAHSLKNSLAEISAEAHRLPGNALLLRAVQGLSRIVADSLYFQQLQSREMGESSLAPPPGEHLPAEELFELLQLRLQAEAEALKVELFFSCDPRVRLFTNLDLSLDALERLVLIAMNGLSPGGVLPVSALADPPSIIITAPDPALWPDPDSSVAFPEKQRLSFLVARGLLEFLDCHLSLGGVGDPASGTCRVAFPDPSSASGNRANQTGLRERPPRSTGDSAP